MDPSPAEQLELYTLMVRSRAFENAAVALAAAGSVPGSWLSGIGQEGTLGAISRLRSDDYLTYTHRGAYGFIGRGSDPARLLAELLGKRTGYAKGKGDATLPTSNMGSSVRAARSGAMLRWR